ncbi:MAG: AbiH family protein [Prevotella sp.]|nr:AbiH family protein [Prevotella sp.]
MKHIALIIGNGFDLSLGFPTSFSDFIESDEFGELLNIGNRLCLYLSEVNMNFRWIDVEIELANYSVSHPYDEDLIDEYEELKDAFFEYISNVDSQKLEIDQNSNAYMVLGENYFGKLDKSDEFKVEIINFNYTETVERIKRSLFGESFGEFFEVLLEINDLLGGEKPAEHIRFWYPHGSIKNNYIIMGVQDSAKISEEHTFLKKTCDINYERFPSRLLEECDEVIFFGHSLGETDHTYFKRFFLNQCEEDADYKKIIISYYKRTGYNQIVKQLDKLTNHNVGKLKENNDLRLIDVSQEFAWEKFE